MRNYLLLAFKILQRHKFYTFVSLFGIAMTLMVLIVITSLIESFVHPSGPEGNSDRFLVAGILTLRQRIDEEHQSTSTNLLGYRFAARVLELKTPEVVSVFSGSVGGKIGGHKVTGFRNGTKILSALKRTDANYWKILQFEFLEGRPISEQEHRQGAYVAVISASTRDLYFPGETAVGKRLTLDGNAFDVIGVVKDVSPLQTLAVADIWLPIFATASTSFQNQDRGEFMALLLARTRADLPLIQQEYQVMVDNFQPLPPEWMDPSAPVEVYSYALSKLGVYLQGISGQPGVPPDQNPFGIIVTTLLGSLMLLFMLLPIMNLININISRILERASEIGVRKSFGASSGHLVRQFVVENLVITALGGALGFLLAMIMLTLIAGAGWLPGESFQFNYRVFALGLLYILVFGLLSAAYPSWKMSRLDPVHALKGAV